MSYEPNNGNAITRKTFNFYDFISDVVTDMRNDTTELAKILDHNGNAITERGSVPFYDFGNILEVRNNMQDKAKVDMYAENSFPLIVLDENTNDILYPDEITFLSGELSMLFVMETEMGKDNVKWTSKERLDNVMKLVLLPLIDLFFKKLMDYEYIFAPGFNREEDILENVNRDFFFFFNSRDVNENTFNYATDVIQLTGLNLRINKNYCRNQKY